jgi:hypothetical protein
MTSKLAVFGATGLTGRQGEWRREQSNGVPNATRYKRRNFMIGSSNFHPHQKHGVSKLIELIAQALWVRWLYENTH